MADKKQVVILGGYGAFGRLISEELARETAVKLTIAGRSPTKGQPFADSIQADFVQCDLTNSESLARTVSDAHLVINAAGPFQALDYTVPEICLDTGCHYIDLGDGRAYVTGIQALHQRAKDKGLFVCVGASTSPAITTAVAAHLQPHFQEIKSIKVALTAGNKNEAGLSTVSSILSYVGAPVQIWQDDQWATASGWGLAEFVTFPKPVGTRRVQLCDVPDLDLMPRMFEADEVLFKAGLEMNLFNYSLSLLGALRHRFPALDLTRLARPLVQASKWFNMFGSWRGSVSLWMQGPDGHERSLAIVAPENGPRVPTSPAILLARKLLKDGPPATGAYPCVGYLTLPEILAYLKPFGIFSDSIDIP